jgi:T-complex protein 1 subunit zeta
MLYTFIQAYADGLLVIPKTLAQNAGYDPQEVMVKLIEESSSGQKVSRNLLQVARSCVNLADKQRISFCKYRYFLCSRV